MLLTSTNNKTLSKAVQSKSFGMSGFNTRLSFKEDDFEPSVSYYLEAYAADDARVRGWPMHVSLDDVKAHPDYDGEIDKLLAIGFKIAQDRGEFPIGTVS